MIVSPLPNLVFRNVRNKGSGVQRGGERGDGTGHPKSEITKIKML